MAIGAALPAFAGQPTPADAGSDWPQWRGPTRNGVLPNSPPLLDAWPEGGPKLLWKSEMLPGKLSGWVGPPTIGGCGSVVVSDGKVFLSSNTYQQIGKEVFVSMEMLNKWGWCEGMPDDLAQKLEAAWKDRKRPREGQEADKYIDDFIAGLDLEQAKKFSTCIRTRLKDCPYEFDWDFLTKLSKVAGKKFDSVQNLAKEAGVSIHGHHYGAHLVAPVDATGQKFFDMVVCLDAKTGKTLWRSEEFPGGMTHYENRQIGASGTPAVVNGKCYATGSAGVCCVSAVDGKTIWKQEAAFTNSSPLVADGLVIVCYGSGLTAYDAETGKVRWKQPKVRSTVVSASPWTSDGKTFVVVGTSEKGGRYNSLACVEAKTGNVLWLATSPSHCATPAIEGDLAAIFNKGKLTAHRLSEKQGETIWSSTEVYDDRGGSAVVHDGLVYAVGGGYRNSGAHCYDLKTGQLKWTEKYPHTECTSAVLADGKVFAFAALKGKGHGTDMNIVMFRATAEKYEQLGVLTCESANSTFNSLSSPTVANGFLYVRLVDAVACYDLRKQ